MDYFKKSSTLPAGFSTTNFPTTSHSQSTASAKSPESFSQNTPKLNVTYSSAKPMTGPYGEAC